MRYSVQCRIDSTTENKCFKKITTHSTQSRPSFCFPIKRIFVIPHERCHCQQPTDACSTLRRLLCAVLCIGKLAPVAVPTMPIGIAETPPIANVTPNTPSSFALAFLSPLPHKCVLRIMRQTYYCKYDLNTLPELLT